MTPAEQQHLFLLASQQPLLARDASDEEISPPLRRVLDALDPLPAFIIGHRWDYLAWNSAGERVFDLSKPLPPHDTNAMWRVFADPASRHRYSPHWEHIAQRVLAEFRADAAPYAGEAWHQRLIADLRAISPEFQEWWPRHDVCGRIDGRKDIQHPLVGWLMFEHTTLQVPTMPDLKMMIHTPVPETDTLEKLHQLMAQDVAHTRS